MNKYLQDYQHQALYKMVGQPMDIYQECKNLYDTTKKKTVKIINLSWYYKFTLALTIRPKIRSFSVVKSSSEPI